MNALITPEQAEALIEAALPPASIERVPLTRSIGRRLSKPLFADRSLPPYPRAMMDGIAFSRSFSPLSGPFTLQGLHAAGDPPPGSLKPGHAWEIMTGACLPADCDTVVPYEDLSEDHTEILTTWEVGQYVHQAGSDAHKGQVLVPKGRLVGAAEVAIAASVGQSELDVFSMPRVALISSGNEAVSVDASPEDWQIRRSNGPMLEALLHHGGVPVVSHQHVTDDVDSLAAVINGAMEDADLLILCGGISKGKKDFMRPVLEQRLGTPLFHGVAQKPGKPLAVWIGPPMVFALPGNPVSVLATFSRYVVPAIKRWSGATTLPSYKPRPTELKPMAKLTWLTAIDETDGLRLVANSGDFCSLSGASGFLEVPAGDSLGEDLQLRYFPTQLTG